MLVFDAFVPPAAGPSLPERTSSFGATVDGNWLCVYGGHVARTHNYSVESVSGRFSRLNRQTKRWEELPAGTSLQGLNLVTYIGKVCRVGGMQPRNKRGEPTDNHSVAESACYNPQSSQWEKLPDLPEARSSHDVAVVGDQLIVTGGWNMRGPQASVWAKLTLILDLKNPSAGWREVSQPFVRRALITAVHGGRMFVIGGIQKSGKVSRDVNIYDPAKDRWTTGPELPGADLNGFAAAAAVHRGKLYVSVGHRSLFVLDEGRSLWTDAGRGTPRVAHRMVSWDDELLIAGGASKSNNFDLVERASIP